MFEFRIHARKSANFIRDANSWNDSRSAGQRGSWAQRCSGGK